MVKRFRGRRPRLPLDLPLDSRGRLSLHKNALNDLREPKSCLFLPRLEDCAPAKWMGLGEGAGVCDPWPLPQSFVSYFR